MSIRFQHRTQSNAQSHNQNRNQGHTGSSDAKNVNVNGENNQGKKLLKRKQATRHTNPSKTGNNQPSHQSHSHPQNSQTRRPQIQPKPQPRPTRNSSKSQSTLLKKLQSNQSAQPLLSWPQDARPNSWDNSNQRKMLLLEKQQQATNSSLQTLYEKFQQMREAERSEMENRGLVDRPETRKSLGEALFFVGTCHEMCPVFERVRRSFENNVMPLEKGSGHKKVKAFSRPAAGQPPPLPSDVRPPSVLKETLIYLVNVALPQLPASHAFLWDRTRSIRQDFTYQNYAGPEAVWCHEVIARIHLVSIHKMSAVIAQDSDVEWSLQQELEQLNKCLQSLSEFYTLCRTNGIDAPNEAEFRAYELLSHLWQAERAATIDRLPLKITQSPLVVQANKFRALASGAAPLAHAFLQELSKPVIFPLLKCILAVHVDQVRRYAARELSKSLHYRSKMYHLKRLASLLVFDDIEGASVFCEHYDLLVSESEEHGLEVDMKSWNEQNVSDKVPMAPPALIGLEQQLDSLSVLNPPDSSYLGPCDSSSIVSLPASALLPRKTPQPLSQLLSQSRPQPQPQPLSLPQHQPLYHLPHRLSAQAPHLAPRQNSRSISGIQDATSSLATKVYTNDQAQPHSILSGLLKSDPSIPVQQINKDVKVPSSHLNSKSILPDVSAKALETASLKNSSLMSARGNAFSSLQSSAPLEKPGPFSNMAARGSDSSVAPITSGSSRPPVLGGDSSQFASSHYPSSPPVIEPESLNIAAKVDSLETRKLQRSNFIELCSSNIYRSLISGIIDSAIRVDLEARRFRRRSLLQFGLNSFGKALKNINEERREVEFRVLDFEHAEQELLDDGHHLVQPRIRPASRRKSANNRLRHRPLITGFIRSLESAKSLGLGQLYLVDDWASPHGQWMSLVLDLLPSESICQISHEHSQGIEDISVLVDVTNLASEEDLLESLTTALESFSSERRNATPALLDVIQDVAPEAGSSDEMSLPSRKKAKLEDIERFGSLRPSTKYLSRVANERRSSHYTTGDINHSIVGVEDSQNYSNLMMPPSPPPQLKALCGLFAEVDKL